jgi:acetyl esterase/lipase
MAQPHPGHVGPLPDWDPEVQPIIDRWPERRPGEDALAALVASRRDRLTEEAMSRGGAFQVSQQSIAGRPRTQDLTIFTPTRTVVRGAIYWLHSGGQVGGAPVSPDIVPVLDIAEERALIVVAAQYALAPEFPAPAGLEDAYNGFVWTAQCASELGYPTERLFLHGLSGGGGLAAGAALRARDAGIRYAGIVLDGPMLDDRFATVSMRQHDACNLPMIDDLRAMWAAATGGNSAIDQDAPYAVPGRLVTQDLSGLPPAYILCGANDPFRDETTAFAEAIWRSGGTADLHQWSGIGHGFDLLAPDAHVSRELTLGRAGWYDRILDRIEGRRAGRSVVVTGQWTKP